MPSALTLQDLLNGKYTDTANKKSLVEYIQNIEDFLKKIQTQLSDKNNQLNFGTKPADITSTFYEQLLSSDFGQISNDNSLFNNFWNASIKELLNSFILLSNTDPDYTEMEVKNTDGTISKRVILYEIDAMGNKIQKETLIPVSDKIIKIDDIDWKIYYRLSDINKATAWKPDAKNGSSAPWVIPSHNSAGYLYEEIRSDEILSALTKIQNTKFTFPDSMKKNNDGTDKIANYVNLILDQYVKDIEVEDLDRNFWVIGEVLTAILNFLYSNNGIFNQLKELLKEIAQLWENTIRLYNLLQNQVQSNLANYIHTEIIYLNDLKNETCSSQYKYDLGSGDTTTDDFDNYIDSLKQSYLNCNLLVVPILRTGYYDKDYHTTEIIPFIYYYSREKDKSHKIYFEWDASKGPSPGSAEEKIINSGSIIFSIEDLIKYTNWSYIDNAKEWTQTISTTGDYYLLKVSPVLEFCEALNEHTLWDFKFTINIQRVTTGGELETLFQLSGNELFLKDDDEIFLIDGEENKKTHFTLSFSKTDDIENTLPNNVNTHYYQGEFLSRLK